MLISAVQLPLTLYRFGRRVARVGQRLRELLARQGELRLVARAMSSSRWPSLCAWRSNALTVAIRHQHWRDWAL